MLTKDFEEYSIEKFKKEKLKPVIDKIYSWRDAAEAHKYIEGNKNFGKLVLKMD